MKRNDLLNPEEYKDGFYYIPGYRNYAINKNGDVLNIKDNKLLTQNTSKDYTTVNLLITDTWPHVSKQMKLHRLVALTFLSTGEFKAGDLQVNHKDFNHRNNTLENLEWLTPSENKEHYITNKYYGQDINSRPVQIRDYNTGKLYKFSSIIDCSKFTHIHKDSVSDRLKLGPLYIFPEGYQYRDKDFDEPWPVPNAFDTTNYFDYGTKKAVLVREWKLNNLTTRFESQREAAQYIGVVESVISERLNRQSQVMLPGLIEIKLDDGKPWEDTKDPWLALQRDFSSTKIVQVIDTINNKTYVGQGGRTGESFVVNDRRFPSDGVGVLSEATKDSGNVAIAVQTPMDPIVANLYGFYTYQDKKELDPTQILSVSNLTMPCTTQDDGSIY